MVIRRGCDILSAMKREIVFDVTQADTVGGLRANVREAV